MSCKDVSKVPRKRLFEMMECMYLIKLKVEGASDLYDGPTGDDGGNDQGLGDDADMDELDHEDDMLGDKFVGGQSKGGSWMGGVGLGSGNSSGKVSGKKGASDGF
jgi:hypothetical protein